MKDIKIYRPEKQGLYNPINEHDACGIGFVANIRGNRNHSIVQNGLEMLENLEHRGAVGSDKTSRRWSRYVNQYTRQAFQRNLKKLL